MSASYYLLNSMPAQAQNGAAMFKAGSLITDPTAIAALQAEGALLWPSTDVVVAAAAAYATKQYAKGQSEEFVSRLMLAAAINSLSQGSEQLVQGGAARTVDLATAAALPSGTFLAGGPSGSGADTFTVTATGATTIDGQTLALNQRVLVKNQATGSQNGIYVCTTAGATGVSTVLTRAPDADSSPDFLPGMEVMTGPTGTTNPTCAFQLTTTGPITLNTTAMTWTKVQSQQEFANGQILQQSVAGSSSSLAEELVGEFVGSGTVIGVYLVPTASEAPAAGSNSQAVTVNIYNAAGVLQAALATGTLNNATQMTKWVRFGLALNATPANLVFADGFFATITSTVTGTATLPTMNVVIVATPN
jgi:hypothetical protein